MPGIVAESDLSGILKSEYIFVNGKRAARIDLANNSVHYYLSDHLNSTSMVISSAGVVEDEADYSAFGTEYPVTSSGGNHYKFSGKERDTESGLDYFGARYYSNAFGRFLTPDWAAKATAVPYANFGAPQTLNLYGYVRNVPTSLVDGDGHGFVNEGFQDWGFDLGVPGWGTGNSQAGPQGGGQQQQDKTSIVDLIRSWVDSLFDGSKRSADASPLGISNPDVADSTASDVGRGFNVVANGAALLDPSGTVSTGMSLAEGRTGEAALGLAFSLTLLPEGSKAEEAVHVYQIVENDRVVYCGITNNLERRSVEHGTDLVKVATMPNRAQARAVEQSLIEHHGFAKNGGTLRNQINSISPQRPGFRDAVRFGFQILESVHYPL
jgi:RHS repeat-associated protein